MIPISESVVVRRTPGMTIVLVAACTLVFLYELALPPRALNLFIERWGVHSGLIVAALLGDPRVPRAELITLFTSQFLHGGWLHLIGNMVFLWVFGRPVEDHVGHVRYLLLYLLGGAGAGIAQSFVSLGEPNVAAIGASGAIATVLGTYLVLFPGAWVTALVPIFFFFWTFDVPAVLMLAFWFIGQFFTGIASISNAAAAGNVAVWAHVAGFLIGVAIGLVLPRGSAPGRAGPVVRRADGPGPARLVASIADLCALILGARIVLLFLGVRPGFGLLGPLARLAYDVTEPFVRPFAELIPTLLLVGRPLDLPAIVLLVLIYALAGWLAGLVGGGRPRPAY